MPGLVLQPAVMLVYRVGGFPVAVLYPDGPVSAEAGSRSAGVNADAVVVEVIGLHQVTVGEGVGVGAVMVTGKPVAALGVAAE